ncbi:MAG: hypothetical protein ACI4SE_03525 [Lachnospiraceae bacterium]
MWKRRLEKIVNPHIAVVILSVVIGVPLLCYSLGYPEANIVVSYISYAVSAYALIVVIWKMPPLIRRIRKGLYANPYSRRYLSEREWRARISLYVGCGINVLYAVFKFGTGIWYHSVWLGAVAVYYMLLSLIRFGLLRKERYRLGLPQEERQLLEEWRTYRNCGYFMLLLQLVITYMVIQLIWENKTYYYPGMLIYVSAAYTFYCFITAIMNMVRFHRMEQPVLSAAKMLSFACAVMSVLALQTAMLTQFSEGQERFVQMMNSITGGCVCVVEFMIALFMIRRANHEIRVRKTDNGEE